MKSNLKVGLRNIKTAVAIFICLLVLEILGRSPLLACIAVIFTMQDTVENSINSGKARLIGTVLGGFYGCLFYILLQQIKSVNTINIPYLSEIIIAIGVAFVIYTLNAINRQSYIGFSLVVYLSIVISITGEPITYSILRVMDTFIGISIAIIINRVIKPKDKNTIENNKKEEETNTDK